LAADNTPPTFISTYPNLTNITGNGARLNVQLDEPGTAYFVLVNDPDGAGGTAPATPTAAQVKAGQDASGTPVASPLSGSFVVPTASTTATTTITGLSGTTYYYAFVVAQDDEGTPNAQASPAEVIFQTTATDTDPPQFGEEFPLIYSITATQFDMSILLNEPGDVIYVLVEGPSTTPSVAQVLAGQEASGAAAFKSGTLNLPTGDINVTITGLESNTAYDLYSVSRDYQTTPNVATFVKKTVITTEQAFDNNSNLSPDPDFMSNPLVLIPFGYTTEEFAYNTLSVQVSDLGTTDGLPTEITQMVFTPAGGNTAAWATVLQGASIKFEGNKINPTNPVIANGSITFDFASNPFVISDGGTALLNLHVWLKTTGITDGQKIQFQVPAAHT